MMQLSNWTLVVFSLSLAVPSGASIGARQSWSNPDPSTRNPRQCLDTSLTNPGWAIFDPALVLVNGSSGGTQGDIRFLTVNFATGESANCTARNIDLDAKGPGAEDVWHNCSIPTLSFQFTLETMEARLKGTWECDNPSSGEHYILVPSLEFTASGPWEIPLIQACMDEWNTPRGQQTLCIMGNSQVSAGLSSPVAIHPQLPLTPYTPRQRARRCVDRSYDPEWQIDGLVYQHRSAEEDSATPGSYDLSLNVTNISNGQSVNCSVTVDLADVHDAYRNGSTPWTRCSGTGASIDVTFDADYGVVGLRQSWECSDGVAGVERDQFSAVAYTNVSLECTTAQSPAAIDSSGPVGASSSTYTCSPSSLPITFTGYMGSSPAMPHTYYSRSCTIRSMTETFYFGVRDYRLEFRASDLADATFTVYNPGSGDTYRFNRMPVRVYGTWDECVPGQEALPWQLVGCKYMVDNGRNRLGLRLQWYCDDRDPSNAILFDAMAETLLPDRVCETREGVWTCVLPVDVAEQQIWISNFLTWSTSGKPMDRGPVLPWI